MKKTLTAFLTMLIVWLVVYLTGSFIEVSFNLRDWGAELRFWFGLMGSLLGLLVFIGVRTE